MSYCWRYLIEPNPKRVSALWNALKPFLQPGDSVYDMFCGYSHLTERLTALGHEVMGLDSHVEAIKYLKNMYPKCEWIQANAEIYYKSNDVKHYDVLLLLGTSHPPMSTAAFQNILKKVVNQMSPRIILMETGISDASKPWTWAFPMTLKTLTFLGYIKKTGGEFDTDFGEEVRHRKYVVLERGKTSVGTIR